MLSTEEWIHSPSSRNTPTERETAQTGDNQEQIVDSMSYCLTIYTNDGTDIAIQRSDWSHFTNAGSTCFRNTVFKKEVVFSSSCSITTPWRRIVICRFVSFGSDSNTVQRSDRTNWINLCANFALFQIMNSTYSSKRRRKEALVEWTISKWRRERIKWPTIKLESFVYHTHLTANFHWTGLTAVRSCCQAKHLAVDFACCQTKCHHHLASASNAPKLFSCSCTSLDALTMTPVGSMTLKRFEVVEVFPH